MKDERIIELVNGELDGTISPSDHNELKTLLDREPSVKTLFDEMEKMDQLLANVPMVDPPQGLKSNVMTAIARSEQPARETSESWLDRLLAPFVQRPAWAVAYAFAIGIAVGLGVFSVIETGPDSAMVQGTIGDLSPVILGTTQVAAGSATADVVVSGLDGELRVDVTITSPEQAILRVKTAGEQPIVIETSSGAPVYSLLIPKASTIAVELVANGSTGQTLLIIDDEIAK